MRSPSIATSPANAAALVPSRIVPPRMTMSCIWLLPPCLPPAACADAARGTIACAAWPRCRNVVAPKRREREMSEQQRVAIVTGAAGGIGRELVLGLLGEKINVA